MLAAARLLLPLLLAAPLLAQDAAPVTSPLGPLVGHVAPGSALLWVRAAPGAREASVRVGGGEARSVPLQARGRGFAVLQVDGLVPDRAQEVAVEVPGGPSGAVRFRTPPPPRAWGKVRSASWRPRAGASRSGAGTRCSAWGDPRTASLYSGMGSWR